MITIEEHFGIIQKLLVPGFGIEIGTLASVLSAAHPDRAVAYPSSAASTGTFRGFESGRDINYNLPFASHPFLTA
jgi:hypothetical protein